VPFSVSVPNTRLTLAVYDPLGRRIRTLFSGTAEAGKHERVWNGTDDAGRPVSSGAYVIQMRTSDQRRSTKVMLLK